MKRIKSKLNSFFFGEIKHKPYNKNSEFRSINKTQVLIERIIMASLLIYFIFLF